MGTDMGRQQPSTPPPPPAVQRLVIRYAKHGRMRFASHRDIARAVERGVRRAGLPVAYSAGFSPHPKISYQGGAPTGAASEAEYLEIALTAALDPDEVRSRLDAALPDGIDVIEAADLAAVTAAPRLEASVWQVVLPGVQPQDAASAVRAFLASEHAEVDRLTSSGVRRLDTREGVVSLELEQRAVAGEQSGCAILRMVVRHLTPAVRPDDILVALRHLSGLEPSSPPRVTRLAQGPLSSNAAAAGASAAGLDTTVGSVGQSWPLTPADPAQASPAGVSSAVASTGVANTAAEGPRPSRRGAAQGQVLATRPEKGDASMAYAAPVSAYGQLPRGAERPSEVGCAREPDGRDRPNARDRATGQRIW
ncbi:MAG TPA: TIGR03936 family radical SAM-associated protein [Streptosporangiaceae bacterium]|nr:TIGR03936 family radical SAM-associated protein [Streptosporangiaceae bacterium]